MQFGSVPFFIYRKIFIRFFILWDFLILKNDYIEVKGMNQLYSKLYSFMRAVQGNWHNALFISCNCNYCPHGDVSHCSGFLMSADADGQPLLMPVSTFRQLTGESIEDTSCRGILGKPIFETVYSQYIEWHTVSDQDCPLWVLSQNNGTPDCHEKNLENVNPP